MTQRQKLENKLNLLLAECNAHKLNAEQFNTLSIVSFLYSVDRANALEVCIELTNTLLELGYSIDEIRQLVKEK